MPTLQRVWCPQHPDLEFLVDAAAFAAVCECSAWRLKARVSTRNRSRRPFQFPHVPLEALRLHSIITLRSGTYVWRDMRMVRPTVAVSVDAVVRLRARSSRARHVLVHMFREPTDAELERAAREAYGSEALVSALV